MRCAGCSGQPSKMQIQLIISNDSVLTVQWILHFVCNTTGNVLPYTGYKEARLCNCVQAKSITYSECVSVALVMQHAKRMRRIILPSVACPTVPYFHIISQNGMIFVPPENLLNTKCAFWVSLLLLSEKFLTRRRIRRDIIIEVHMSVFMWSIVMLVWFWPNFTFIDKFSKNTQM